MLLENHAGEASELSQFSRVEIESSQTFDDYLTACGPIQEVETAEQCRLAGAGRPQQHRKVSPVESEACRTKRLGSAWIAHSDPVQFNHSILLIRYPAEE